jgi:hypothetical protein
MAHKLKGMAGGDGISAVDIESPHLSLCRQGHDCLENLCNCEDGAIVRWFGSVVGHGEMSALPGCMPLFWRGTMRCCVPRGPCHSLGT